MKFITGKDRNQTEFFCLEQAIAQDNEVRLIDLFISSIKLQDYGFVNEKVVGETSFDDCLHIATATLNKVDILVSWNFKHIVNVYRIRGYNSINLRLGYMNLNIHSPKEIVGNEI